MAGTLTSGRRPKPTALHELHGTRSKARGKRALEPQPQGDLVEPPEKLVPEERAEWDFVLQNTPRGMLKRIDRQRLLRWVRCCERLRIAEAALSRVDARGAGLPLLVRGPNGPELSPYLRIIDRETLAMIRLSDRLGFSPVARPRIQMDAPPPDTAAAAISDWGVLKQFPVVKGGKA
jgi:phage terminase small subunit